MLTARYRKDIDQLSSFTEVVFDRLPRVDQAIESGEKNFIDLISVLEQKKKFSSWAGPIPLIGEYVQTITSKTWVEKLPAKSGRFALFTGAGPALEPLGAMFGIPGAATAGAVALAAIDSFLLSSR